MIHTTTFRRLILSTILALAVPITDAAPAKTAANKAVATAKAGKTSKPAAKNTDKAVSKPTTSGKSSAKNSKTAPAAKPAANSKNSKAAAVGKTAKPAANGKAAAPAKTAQTPCGKAQSAVFQAAAEGRLDALKQHKNNKCDLKKTDPRGFTLYDIAILNGRKNITDWLVANKIAQKNQYSSALVKLVQTGLRYLGHDAGAANGKQTAATAKAIKAFQRANHLSQSGKIDAAWLPAFNKELGKKTQNTLKNLGYKTGKNTGISTAIQAFRQERKMAKSGSYLDDQLIYQLMLAENEAGKKTDKRKGADRRARLAAQNAAQQQEEAQRSAENQRKAAEARARAEAAAREAAEEERRIAEQERIEDEQRAARNAAELAAARQQTEAATREAQQLRAQAQNISNANPGEVEQRRLNEERAARRAAAAAQAERARQQAEAARRAEEQARQQAQTAARSAAQARVEAQNALRTASDPILAQSAGRPAAKPRGNKGFTRANGILSLGTSGGVLSSCSVGGRSIDIGWCQQYYPDGDGRQCSAVISNSGIVVSLTCK